MLKINFISQIAEFIKLKLKSRLKICVELYIYIESILNKNYYYKNQKCFIYI